MENYVIIASLKRETMGKLISRIPGSCLLISSLPGSALRTHVESPGKPDDVNKRSRSIVLQFDIKRHSPSFLFIYHQFHIPIKTMNFWAAWQTV